MNASYPPRPALTPKLTHPPDRRMGLRQAHDPPRTPPQTPTRPRKDPARTRPRTSKTRKPREEADPRHQEERQEWTNGGLQNPSERSRQNEEIHTEVLLDAHATPSSVSADPDR